MNTATDYQNDDFDYAGAEWVDATPVGLVDGVYEEQLDIRSPTGQVRHRHHFDPTSPWKRGTAPKQ